MKIVSLLPGATEIICKLGFKSNLVGRSHSCDYPEDIASVPVLTEPRLETTTGKFASGHKTSQEVLKASLGAYNIKTERLHAIQPDIIITQTQCAACAVTKEQVEYALKDMTGKKPMVVDLTPVDLDDVYRDIYKVGNALDAHKNARELVAEMHNRIETIHDKVLTKKGEEGIPYTGVLEWVDPLMTAGHWLPTLINRAGGINIPTGFAGKPARVTEVQEIAGYDPEVLIMVPCGLSLHEVKDEFKKVEDQDDWKNLKAVIQGEVYLVDGNYFFNRPGPRLKESVEIAAEILHPDLFRRKWERYGWLKANEE